MAVQSIDPVEQGEQAPLFTVTPIADEDLLADQGIEKPQGLDSLAHETWDEVDDAYLAALLDD